MTPLALAMAGNLKSARFTSLLLEQDWSGSIEFTVFRFPLLDFIPAAKIERDSHAGGAQFISKSAVDHRSGHDHASYGQRGYALCGGTAKAALLAQAAL
jgi:hypothetical protein